MGVIAERVLEPRAGPDAPRLSSFISGRYDDGDSAGDFEVFDPATGKLIARVAEAGPAGVDRAVAAGEAAFAAWRAMPARDRAALVQELAQRIERNAERLAHLDTLDTGNPLSAMKQDLTKGVRTMRDAAGLALQMTGLTFPLPGLHYTQREPWGVVGRLITFNHPAMYACARFGAALVAGNCVVMKPSELAPIATLAIAELTAGLLPDGVVSVVVGGPATGDAIVRHPSIQRISFTGSTPTALRIQASAAASGHLKALSFELGGKNPIVVFPDVDRDEVAAAIVRGMNYTRVQGQSCGSTSRLVIQETIAEDVLARVAARAAKIKVGMPMDPATEMGAMISRTARDRCLGVVDRAVREGARVIAGATVPDDPALAGGAFLTPTVVDRVAPGSELANEEIFGPVLGAMTWRTEDEALALANAGRYGLTAAIWTQDIDRALRMADRTRAGYIWINDVETRFPAVPFGGWGDSGIGLEHGLEEILSFTRVKAVNVRVR
ncbi:MAG: aldehyde dehydrogenase family protein [Chloroflexota bacterium]|nr:aldehyde dehydrogenase family protein [Chloroflexota bacterium]